MSREVGTGALGVLVLAGLLFWGCGGGGQAGEETAAKAEIQSTLEEYLPQMALAYRTGNLEPLRQWVVEKEVATLYKRVSDLADRGMTVEPELRQVTVETVGVWSHSNAVATTLEVWDVRYYSTGSRNLISESLEQANRVKYQFKREDDRWWVLFVPWSRSLSDRGLPRVAIVGRANVGKSRCSIVS